MTIKWLTPAILALHLTSDGPAIAGEQLGEATATPTADQKTLLNGFRRYHSLCNHCHGPDGLGSSFGPSLIAQRPDPETFKRVVLKGVPGKMKGFDGNADVIRHLDAILAYIDARSTGALGRGRPQ